MEMNHEAAAILERYGLENEAAEAALTELCSWLINKHQDGRTMGEVHGWASRYTQYVFQTGNTKTTRIH